MFPHPTFFLTTIRYTQTHAQTDTKLYVATVSWLLELYAHCVLHGWKDAAQVWHGANELTFVVALLR